MAIDSIVKRDDWSPDELPPVDDLRRVLENAGVGDESRIILRRLAGLRHARMVHARVPRSRRPRCDSRRRVPTLDGRDAARRHQAHSAAGEDADALSGPNRVASLGEVRDASAFTVLIDARSGFEFHGFGRGANVARRGHIPGAECSPWRMNYARDGTFLSEATLRAKYEKLVPDRDSRVIVYCRTGMDASVPYFVLRSLGYDVALYDGSYAEWSRDRSLRVVKLSSRK